MAIYKYKATTYDGIEETGTVKVKDQPEAIRQLKAEYEVISSLKEVREKEDFRDTLNIRKIKEKNLALICEQFAIILKAGMPIIRTIEMVADQTDDKYIKQVLLDVAEDVEAGKGMADSFEERGPKLPVTFIETIRAGEESGSLDLAFSRMSVYFSKKSKTRDKVVSALTYPAFIVAVAVVVVAIIMIVAVPMFTEAFLELDIELPLATKIVIAVSNFFVHWGWVIALLIIGCIVALKFYERKPENKQQTDKIRLKLPILGKVHLMNGCSQFANTLSTLMAAGLPAMRAIEITGRAMSNRYLGDNVEETADDVQQGFQIGNSIRSKEIFPDLLTEMTSVGENTGSMEETLGVVGEYYDNEVENVTTRATKLLEPIIICVLAVVVVAILLSVYMPMFSMYDAM